MENQGKTREQLLRELEGLCRRVAVLQAIYDGIVDGVLIADVETKHFVRANGSICRMLGYSEAELLSLSLADIHPADDLPRVLETFQAQAEGRLVQAEGIPLLRKDGTVFFADITTKQVVYRERPCVVGFFRDATKRRKVQEELRESEEKHRRLIENLRQEYFFYRHGTDRVFTYLSPSITTVLGYSVDEFKTHYTRCLTDNPINRDVVRFSELAIEGKQQPPYEVELFHKDGSVRRLEVLEQPIFDEQGAVRCVEGIAHDITERKRTQEALERERQTLFHMLKASDHERQLISYDIHDGLAQQLASAIMQLEAYSSLKEHDPERAKTAYDAGVDMLRRAQGEARRLTSGVRPPILDESGITAALAHLVHEHSTPTGPNINIGFHSEVKVGRLAKVLENAVYRIAQEALTNALHHSGSERVKVSLIQDDNELRLEIRDWGVGFEHCSIDKNGFGLQGIRERTRLLGGDLTVESEPGKGTCISVVLPIVEEE